MKNTIHPCLWFDGQAKAAAEYYCSIFNNSKILADNPMVVTFQIEGEKVMGLNGGPMFKKNASISLFVNCESDEEITRIFGKLLEGGSAMMPLDKYPWAEKYGWVIDQFGMTWQLMINKPVDGHKIHPAFLFVGEQYGKAQPAMRKYADLFPNSKVHHLELSKEGGQGPVGMVEFGHLTLDNKIFSAMDGFGQHEFTFNEGVSLVVPCDTQEEIDKYWNALTSNGGEESMCGWLKDEFGVSWQIIPSNIETIMTNPEKGPKAMDAIMKMKKIVIADLV